MAAIAKSGTPSLASLKPGPNEQTTGLVAGEAIGPFDACRIHTDGKVYKSSGAAANASAEVHGYAAGEYAAGDKGVTLYHGTINVRYGSGLTPGANVFLSATTAGGLEDAATTGGTRKLGFVLDATRIRFYAVQGR